MGYSRMRITMWLEGYVLFASLFGIARTSLVLNKTMDLHEVLLSNYAKYIRPCIGCSSPLTVNLTFHLTNLNDLDELKGEMNTVGYLTAVWMEDRMSWKPDDYAGITSMLLTTDEIWIPSFLLGNPSETFIKFTTNVPFVRVLYDGKVIWSPGDVFRTTCMFNIYKFPFDTQNCTVTFLSWSNTADEIHLQTPDDTIQNDFFGGNGEWKLETTAAAAHESNQLSFAHFHLIFKRRSDYFVINIIIPMVFLSFLNCMVYIIPPESGERISYAITVLLSFAVFTTLVNDNIPKTSAPISLLCYYLLYIFIGSVLIVMSTIFNMKLFQRDQSLPVPFIYRKLTGLVFPCRYGQLKDQKCMREHVVKVQPIDVAGDDSIQGKIVDQIKEVKINEESTTKDLTWVKVASAIDTLCFVGCSIYYLAVSLRCFLELTN